MPADQRVGRVLSEAETAALAAYRSPDREPLRRTPGHRVGASGWKVLDSAVPADHRAARGRGGSATDWTVPKPPLSTSAASIVEQLPDPLSPLFADLDRRLGDRLAAELCLGNPGRVTSSGIPTSGCQRSMGTPTTGTADPAWGGSWSRVRKPFGNFSEGA